ncbi:HAD-like domain-containing protein [Tribonema minus]|uniref:5'-nucleotidase n=1 Tax=Tribonema minus TaxID=303371 RepID=A0A835Z4R3_9STRA|nr:HAD-like domain-containing protein [Tribonema minus]
MFGRSKLLTDANRAHMEMYLTGVLPEGHAPLLAHGEWWDRVHALLAEHPMTRKDIEEMVRENVESGQLRLRPGTADFIVTENVESGQLRLRPGAADFIRLCHSWDIPLLIVSAGVSDVIEETLRHQGVLLPNVRIHSNSMVYCETSGGLKAFSTAVVHSRNKVYFETSGGLKAFSTAVVHSRDQHESHQREREFFEGMQRAGRTCALILGDKPHDARVADGAPLAATLAVSFYDAAECALNALALADYTAAFDACCTGESMGIVADLVRDLTGGVPPAAVAATAACIVTDLVRHLTGRGAPTAATAAVRLMVPLPLALPRHCDRAQRSDCGSAAGAVLGVGGAAAAAGAAAAL